MKTFFIINPAAGQGKNTDLFVRQVKNVISETGADAEIYLTKCVGDAKIFTLECCEKYGATRLIACGGDGTLNEVVNGASMCSGAEIGVIPIGTGNDFCRNFEYDFYNILGQLTGKTVKCDAIRYTTFFDGYVKEGYGVNMFNIGFDCNVADLTAEMKKKPLISGSFAYFTSILVTLIKKKCSNLKIEIDGQERHNGQLLLSSVANGSFCGGGIKSNPLASLADGEININIIKNVTRMKFISLLPHYMKGTFLNLSNIEKYIASEKCREVIISPNGGHMRLCIDGEIIDAGQTRFEIVHNAFNFILPGMAEDNLKQSNKELQKI